ncbi:hypothetical protein [Legionella taurinensis]|nr:hypothetical protein [Legionella taurinensis]MDX1836761.1 hypothetical protein [Legionella taurinensis]
MQNPDTPTEIPDIPLEEPSLPNDVEPGQDTTPEPEPSEREEPNAQ